MTGRLAGKVAVITGAGQGIGLGIARAFIAAGADLVITGRDEGRLARAAEELAAIGGRVAASAGDAGDPAAAQRAVQTALDRFGGLDVLVNNAQSSKPGTPLEETDEATLRMTLGSGLFGTFHHMQAAFPHLQARGGGSIINFGSREGIFGGVGFGAYAATKEAIRGLSRVAAREWGRHGVRVNVLCPAALSPKAVTYLEEHPAEAEMYRREISLGRFGDPEDDIGSVALFLACDDSRYVTGQTINVDGGQMML
ncbi:SDR family NAD(P)-dependent oxidoreductase [Phenylobacterium sp. LjRoot225]|uniref:SDR family NAD(P)-dependent oxidoreductase n=1 Tax=Phenylobacterium sp. LjRoot225 TaxID=3342285 RepID=UPI003ECE5E9A